LIFQKILTFIFIFFLNIIFISDDFAGSDSSRATIRMTHDASELFVSQQVCSFCIVNKQQSYHAIIIIKIIIIVYIYIYLKKIIY